MWIVAPDGTNRVQLSGFAGGVGEAVVDASGKSVVAFIEGRIVRIDIESGEVVDLVPNSLPSCTWNYGKLSPVSVFFPKGEVPVATARVGTVPLPLGMPGVRILPDDEPLPFLSAAADGVWTNRHSVLRTGIVFERCSPVNVRVLSRSPYFAGDGAGLTVYHEDFSGTVDRNSPAKPGEVVHASALGLGAVTPPLPTGVPAPLGQLHVVAEPFDCTRGDNAIEGQPVEVVFAGLVPETIGIYQVDVRLPSPLARRMVLSCGTPGERSLIRCRSYREALPEAQVVGGQCPPQRLLQPRYGFVEVELR